MISSILFSCLSWKWTYSYYQHRRCQPSPCCTCGPWTCRRCPWRHSSGPGCSPPCCSARDPSSCFLKKVKSVLKLLVMKEVWETSISSCPAFREGGVRACETPVALLPNILWWRRLHHSKGRKNRMSEDKHYWVAHCPVTKAHPWQGFSANWPLSYSQGARTQHVATHNVRSHSLGLSMHTWLLQPASVKKVLTANCQAPGSHQPTQSCPPDPGRWARSSSQLRASGLIWTVWPSSSDFTRIKVMKGKKLIERNILWG